MLFIIFLLAALYILVATFLEIRHRGWETIAGAMGSGLFATAFLSFMCIVFFSEVTSTEYSRTSHRDKIYSLRSQEQVSGSFVLGCGGFGTNEIYSFFRKKEDINGYYRDTATASNTFIIESESEHPNIFWQKIEYRANPWIIPARISLRRYADTSYHLTVPTGTIIQKFEVR